MTFFPCIYFCESNALYFTDNNLNLDLQFKDDLLNRYKNIISRSEKRQYFYVLLWKLVSLAKTKRLQIIIENPWNTNGLSYLQSNFIKPTIIDNNRMLRGDVVKKPTAYWFIGREPTRGFTWQLDKEQKKIRQCKKGSKAGLCSEERSMIHPDYARNFICDFILGKVQNHTQLNLFEN